MHPVVPGDGDHLPRSPGHGPHRREDHCGFRPDQGRIRPGDCGLPYDLRSLPNPRWLPGRCPRSHDRLPGSQRIVGSIRTAHGIGSNRRNADRMPLSTGHRRSFQLALRAQGDAGTCPRQGPAAGERHLQLRGSHRRTAGSRHRDRHYDLLQLARCLCDYRHHWNSLGDRVDLVHARRVVKPARKAFSARGHDPHDAANPQSARLLDARGVGHYHQQRQLLPGGLDSTVSQDRARLQLRHGQSADDCDLRRHLRRKPALRLPGTTVGRRRRQCQQRQKVDIVPKLRADALRGRRRSHSLSNFSG